ncbi:MAG: hypothetical protein MUC60_07280 [Oscillatoria sp. Prado101]|nr:hypothetical protein [Oscillatoria sp. Prado101]
MTDSRDFISPRSRYHGQFSPQNLAFDANLQEFAQKVSIICALETGGKLSPDQAYEEIRTLWNRLKTSKKQLGIGEPPPEGSQENSQG